MTQATTAPATRTVPKQRGEPSVGPTLPPAPSLSPQRGEPASGPDSTGRRSTPRVHGHAASSRLVCALAVALVCVEAVPAARALDSEPLVGRALTSSFLCTWKWDLQPGLRTGYVTAGNGANCAGRQGSLTLSIRLLRWSPKSEKWNVDKAQTRTWTDLRANRYVEVAERCSKSTVRVVFDWGLRDAGRTVITATH